MREAGNDSNFQRLEYLGDAVLDLCASRPAFFNWPPLLTPLFSFARSGHHVPARAPPCSLGRPDGPVQGTDLIGRGTRTGRPDPLRLSVSHSLTSSPTSPSRRSVSRSACTRCSSQRRPLFGARSSATRATSCRPRSRSWRLRPRRSVPSRCIGPTLTRQRSVARLGLSPCLAIDRRSPYPEPIQAVGDLVEAVIGALMVDGGYSAVEPREHFFDAVFKPFLSKYMSGMHSMPERASPLTVPFCHPSSVDLAYLPCRAGVHPRQARGCPGELIEGLTDRGHAY